MSYYFIMLLKRLLTGACLILTAATQTAPVSTGRQQLTFTERDARSAPDEVARRLDLHEQPQPPADAGPKDTDYDLTKESFDVFIPGNYKPDVSQGLLLWTGVSEFSPQWFEVLVRHKLIYVAPRDLAGHGTARIGLAIDAVNNMKQRFNIDDKRIYISGFSNGASFASQTIAGYPDVFDGGLFLNSGSFYILFHNQPTITHHNASWKGALDQIRREKRLVFMWGERDPQYTADECRGQCDSLVLDGFERVACMIVPGEGHAPPNAAWFEKGIVALDQTKPKAAPTTAPTTQPHPLPGQIAQASESSPAPNWSCLNATGFLPDFPPRRRAAKPERGNIFSRFWSNIPRRRRVRGRKRY